MCFPGTARRPTRAFTEARKKYFSLQTAMSGNRYCDKLWPTIIINDNKCLLKYLKNEQNLKTTLLFKQENYKNKKEYKF